MLAPVAAPAVLDAGGFDITTPAELAVELDGLSEEEAAERIAELETERVAARAELQDIVGDETVIDDTCSVAGVPVFYRRQLIAFGQNASVAALEAMEKGGSMQSFKQSNVGESAGSGAIQGTIVDEIDGAALIDIPAGADINAVVNTLELVGDLTVTRNHVLTPQPGFKWKPEAGPTATGRQRPVALSGGAGQTIAVLDTGLPAAYAASVPSIGAPEIVDANEDGVVDNPSAGHGLFISNLVEGLVPDATVVSVNIINQDDPQMAALGLADEWSFYAAVQAALAGDADRGIPPATILNASVGTYVCDGTVPVGLKAAVDAVAAAGAVMTTSAGNEGVRKAAFYPAAFSCENPHVIAVGALDFDAFPGRKQRSTSLPKPIAAFSNTTGCRQMFAVGTNVVSTWIEGARWGSQDWNGGQPAGKNVIWQGTSMSAPIVAAELAREAARLGVAPAAAVEALRAAGSAPTKERTSTGALVTLTATADPNEPLVDAVIVDVRLGLDAVAEVAPAGPTTHDEIAEI